MFDTIVVAFSWRTFKEDIVMLMYESRKDKRNHKVEEFLTSNRTAMTMYLYKGEMFALLRDHPQVDISNFQPYHKDLYVCVIVKKH